VDTEVEMKQAAADLREEAGLPPASTSAAPTEQKDVEMVRHPCLAVQIARRPSAAFATHSADATNT